MTTTLKHTFVENSNYSDDELDREFARFNLRRGLTIGGYPDSHPFDVEVIGKEKDIVRLLDVDYPPDSTCAACRPGIYDYVPVHLSAAELELYLVSPGLVYSKRLDLPAMYNGTGDMETEAYILADKIEEAVFENANHPDSHVAVLIMPSVDPALNIHHPHLHSGYDNAGCVHPYFITPGSQQRFGKYVMNSEDVEFLSMVMMELNRRPEKVRIKRNPDGNRFCRFIKPAA